MATLYGDVAIDREGGGDPKEGNELQFIRHQTTVHFSPIIVFQIIIVLSHYRIRDLYRSVLIALHTNLYVAETTRRQRTVAVARVQRSIVEAKTREKAEALSPRFPLLVTEVCANKTAFS